MGRDSLPTPDRPPSTDFASTQDSGLYQLVIRLRVEHVIKVGRLGRFEFPAGYYVYTGSALRGLESRIHRHLSKRKKMRWHIDYLLRYGNVIRVERYRGVLSECELGKSVGTLPGSTVLVPGFGSSDCSCATHLFHFGRNPHCRISLPTPRRKSERSEGG
jgi:Uri superfamily endonuclease